jgi:hypothetical protein
MAVSKALVAITVVVLAILLGGPAAWALQITVMQGTLPVIIQSAAGVLPTDQGVAVSAQVMIKTEAPANSLTTISLDDKPLLISNDPQPTVRMDTTKLADGAHRLKVDATGLDGTKLASATDLVLDVANVAGPLKQQVAQTTGGPAPTFLMLYRRYLPREVVWFNGREGDLEKHGFRAHGQIYLTATDLFRHIGGTILWGPTSNWIELHRGDVVVRIIPGSRAVVVNGTTRNLGAPCVRKDDQTYVPVQALCAVLGLNAAWNSDEQRVYVTFQP